MRAFVDLLRTTSTRTKIIFSVVLVIIIFFTALIFYGGQENTDRSSKEAQKIIEKTIKEGKNTENKYGINIPKKEDLEQDITKLNKVDGIYLDEEIEKKITSLHGEDVTNAYLNGLLMSDTLTEEAREIITRKYRQSIVNQGIIGIPYKEYKNNVNRELELINDGVLIHSLGNFIGESTTDGFKDLNKDTKVGYPFVQFVDKETAKEYGSEKPLAFVGFLMYYSKDKKISEIITKDYDITFNNIEAKDYNLLDVNMTVDGTEKDDTAKLLNYSHIINMFLSDYGITDIETILDQNLLEGGLIGYTKYVELDDMVSYENGEFDVTIDNQEFSVITDKGTYTKLTNENVEGYDYTYKISK